MFRIIDFKSLLRYTAIITTILSIGAYELVQSYWLNDLKIVKILSIAPWIALLLTVALTTSLTARALWRVLKKVNPSLYPDLNGTWEGEITTEKNQVIPVRVLIKQTLLETQINIHTQTSKSLTLETTPTIESGEPKLYYIYRSLPKDPNWSSYTGSTIFDIRNVGTDDNCILELSGYYYTDRKTTGRIRFSQVGSCVKKDVSFY
ncbi:hypothetical protein NRA66_08560 [Acinetobacter baumannii]|uniref:Cap15 family cyclic dinucleotide receptor domain-containing protein n=1 Tax=Acinetobacter baumannii TaxID=470 RepID=UPI0003DFA931|nr:hypothetical protein [Acinetobacter baumannii]ETQ99871.1 hypothetical protein P673_0027 [Acinetobacter baumannii UH6507]MDC4674494.1 hypothetical protein [Acinetobacter baumannii]MDC4692637.1 hypothetical protein [Acinetobacter baumannii]MDC5317370.1 hypothetical protein [Acinetobacter baumannii]MDC5549519.1 hypothetical protein [Acinetobacter baumannii]